jgi:acyl phosphate:glycerol-3-phosphate acyltransferase
MIVDILGLLVIYGIGVFPTGQIIARAHGVEITASGSKNPGATNVARVVGKRAGLLTLVGDTVKGMAGVGIARLIWTDSDLIAAAGLAVVLGHSVSVPGYLRGGKGVAPSLGAITALYPPTGLVALGTFGLMFLLTRYVSVASMTAAGAVPLFAIFVGLSEAVCLSFAGMALTIFVRHRENLSRLIRGEEKRFGRSEPAPAAE